MRKYLKYAVAMFLAGNLVKAEETTKTAKPVNLDQDAVVWAYEVHAELPTSAKKLAGYVSADYTNASDEFERQELLEQIKPIIKKRIEKAKQQKLYSIRTTIRLAEYDFDRKGFPTGISENTFFTYGGRYASRFAATEGINFIPVSKEKAKSVIKNLSYRRCTLEVIAHVEEVKDKSINRYMRKTVYLLPQKLILYGGEDQNVKLIELNVSK